MKTARTPIVSLVSVTASVSRGLKPAPSEPTGKRVPWNGGLSDEELIRPGGALMAALLSRANQVGDQLAQMSDALNVTYGYIAQLRGGHRLPENISEDFINAAAVYLDVPRMTVLMLSGKVKPDDVLLQKHNIAQQIPAAIDFISRDVIYGPLMPLEVRKQSYEMQFFVVSMYEKATGKVLLDGRQDPVLLAQDLAEALSQREALLAKVEPARKLKQKTA
jgi:hypothetical protein